MSNASHRVKIPRVRNYQYEYKPIPFQYEFEIEIEELGMFGFEKNYLRNTIRASDQGRDLSIWHEKHRFEPAWIDNDKGPTGRLAYTPDEVQKWNSASDLVSKEGESLPPAEDIYCFTCRRKVAKVDGRHVGGKEPWYDLPVNDEPRNAWTCSSECHETYNHAKYVMNRK